jgi:hypothetical protein
MRVAAALAAVVLALVPGGDPLRAQAQLTSEIKAAYLLKLAPFITWPSGAWSQASPFFVICIVGPDPFGGVIDKLASGEQAHGRQVAVRRLGAAERRSGCNLAYVSGSLGFVKEQAASLKGAPVLTVTDGSGVGMVDFVQVQNRVRFRIDEQAASDSGLGISSQLLDLAVAVRSRAKAAS